MYAVIETGGKQYKVNKGDKIRVEKLDTEVGKKVTFDRVLMLGGDKTPKIGTPTLKGTKVEGKILNNGRYHKIKVFKKIRRKGYRRTHGHRQDYTEVEITGIKSGAAYSGRKMIRSFI